MFREASQRGAGTRPVGASVCGDPKANHSIKTRCGWAGRRPEGHNVKKERKKEKKNDIKTDRNKDRERTTARERERERERERTR